MSLSSRCVAALGALSCLASIPACDEAAPPVAAAPREALAVTQAALSVPVTIANGPANAVPTYNVDTAKVAVQNTVQAAQAGTWGVSITNPSLAVTLAGTPTVTLAGTPSVRVDGEVFVANTDEAPIPVRQVDAGAAQPWAGQRALTIAEGAIAQAEPLVTVPTGKRLVIEHVDAFLVVPEGQGGVTALLTTVVGGHAVQFGLPLVQTAGFGGVDRFAVAQGTKLYADAESEVRVELVRNDISGQAQGRVTVSGYLVDVE